MDYVVPEVMFVDSRSGSGSRLKSKKIRVQVDEKYITSIRTISIFKDSKRMKIQANGHCRDFQKMFKASFSDLCETKIILTPYTTLQIAGTVDVAREHEESAKKTSSNIKVPVQCDFTDYLRGCKTIVVSTEDNGYKIYGHGISKKVDNGLEVVLRNDGTLMQMKIVAKPSLPIAIG